MQKLNDKYFINFSIYLYNFKLNFIFNIIVNYLINKLIFTKINKFFLKSLFLFIIFNAI